MALGAAAFADAAESADAVSAADQKMTGSAATDADGTEAESGYPEWCEGSLVVIEVAVAVISDLAIEETIY